MKIGIDFHGVIDQYPELFAKLTKSWISQRIEVHIITGKEWEDVDKKLKNYNISYSSYYSIVDYHKSIGTKMKKESNGWWMPEDTWNRSKGEYCQRAGISVHFDNDIQYAFAFPDNCTFIWVRKNNFPDCLKIFEKLSI